MRAVVSAGLWAVLSMSGVGALAAQTDTDAVRDTTRQRLATLLASYEPAQEMHFQRSGSEPFDIVGSYDRHLFYASRLEIIVTVTTKQTIGFRVYPYWHGAHINLNRVRRPSVLMQKLLRDADQSFFHWAVNPDRDVFAGFTFTLESGFPEDAIDIVIRSIPLLDRSVGELAPLIE